VREKGIAGGLKSGLNINQRASESAEDERRLDAGRDKRDGREERDSSPRGNVANRCVTCTPVCRGTSSRVFN